MHTWNRDSRGNSSPTRAYMVLLLLRWARRGPPPWKQYAKLRVYAH